MMREDRAHRLVDSAFAVEAEEPSESFERRVLRAIGAARRESAGTTRQGGGGWFPRAIPSRSSMILVAACVAVAVGVTSAFAQTGALSDGSRRLLSAMGLTSAVTGARPVEATATDAGLTVHAIAGYRDHYLVAISARVDGAGTDRIDLIGPSAQPTATTSSGEQLRLWGAAGSADGITMVLGRPDLSALTGADVTVTVHAIIRCARHAMPVGPTGPPTGPLGPCGDAGHESTTSGTWAITLHLPVQGSLARTLLAPAGQRLDGVQVGFHDLRSNGSYLFVDEDVSEETPGALSRALTFVPSDRKATSDPLWLTVYDSNGNEMPTLFQNSDAPGGKGSPAGPLTAGPYHWSYLFTLPGPGTYRLVVHGAGGDQLVRTIQVP
jgi:hypothetical protein